MFNISNLLSAEKLRYIRNAKIKKWLSWDILELWCWEGFIPNFLKENNSNQEYVGIDFQDIKNISTKFPQFLFIQHDLDENIILKKKFDTIISSAVIEHIYNQKNFFKTATENLKPNGKLVITTPTVFGNDIVYPILCKMGFRKWNWVLSDHITIYNKDRFNVVAQDFNLKVEHFEHFEFFCNQLIVFKKITL